MFTCSQLFTMCALWTAMLMLPWLFTQAVGPVHPFDLKMTFNKDILAVGDTLQLNCSVTTNESATLEVHHNHRSLTEFVTYSDDRHIEIVIRNVTMEQHGMYHCYKNKDMRPSTISVHVGYPPQKPTHIRCISDNLENMTCHWDPVKTSEELNIKTNWTLFYKIGINNELDRGDSLMHVYACHNPQKAMACHWFKHEQHIGGDYFRPGYFYLIWVTATNKLGSATSDAQLVDTRAIVKLQPVTGVSVSAISDSSVHVNWTMKFPPITRLKLIYNVSLTCTDCLTAHLWQIGSISRQKRERRHLMEVVNDLEPYTIYTVSVRVKTKSGGHWSDSSEPVTATTLEGVPRGSPRLTNASFTLFYSPSKGRQLSVYWQALERTFQGGLITEYLVDVTPPTLGSKGQSVGHHRLTGSMLMLSSLTLEDGKQYKVRVAAATKHGHGPYSQPLVIPPDNRVTPSMTMVTAEVNSSHAFVSWSRPNTDFQVTNFLIHYCQGHITQLGTDIAQCTDGYSWLVVIGNQTSATVVMPDHQDASKYVIGVSMETELGSSGIMWSPCAFKLQGMPGKIQKLEIETTEYTSATLTWFPLTCLSSRVKVGSYQVSICEAEVEGRCTCGQGRITEYIGVWDLATARVERLRSGQTYSLCVRALGMNGPGAWSDGVRVTTHTPAPWGVILGCSLAGVFLIVIMLLWFGIRHYLMTPVVDSFDIPKAVNLDLYDRSGTKEEEGASREDNFYTLVQGEEQPLMAIEETLERPSNLQHVPVSHDSGNDSLSEESGQQMLDNDQMTTPLTTPKPTPLAIRAKHIPLSNMDSGSRGGEDEDRETVATNSSPPRLKQKRESGFFDDIGPQQKECESKKKKPLAMPTVEAKVGAVCREDPECSESITAYSRFEQQDEKPGPNSSSLSSYIVYDDINNTPKPGLKQPPLNESRKSGFCPTKLKHHGKMTKNKMMLDNVTNNNIVGSDGKDVQVEVDEMEFEMESNQDDHLDLDVDELDQDLSCMKSLPTLPKSDPHGKQPVVAVPYVQISSLGHSYRQGSGSECGIPAYVSATPESLCALPGSLSRGAQEAPLKVTHSGGYVSHQQIPSLANPQDDSGALYKKDQSIC